MRAHEPGPVLRMLFRSAKEVGMDQVDRADVEGGRHANLAAEVDHAFGEVEARAPMIKTAVDMRRLDVDEGARIDGVGETHEKTHGEGRARAMRAAEEFTIERGEVKSHSWATLRLSDRDRQMRAGAPMSRRVRSRLCQRKTATTNKRCLPFN